MHQIAEYIIAAVFIAQGLQSKTPAIPSVLGGLVLVNAACAKGPAAAFQLLPRSLHKVLDLVLIGVIVAMAVQPVISLDNNTRVIMGVLAFVIGFVWLGSDFSPSVKRERSKTIAAGARVASTLRQATTQATTRASTAAPSQPRPAATTQTSAKTSTQTSTTTSTRTSTKAASGTASGSKAEDIGRTAGRLAGKGVNMYRSRKARGAQPKQ